MAKFRRIMVGKKRSGLGHDNCIKSSDERQGLAALDNINVASEGYKGFESMADNSAQAPYKHM